MRLAPRHDTVFSFCLSAAIALLCLALATSCSHPLPDLGKVPRGQFSRTVSDGTRTCQAWLPLIIQSEIGQEYVALALQAAQPWVDSVSFAVAVPALEGEQPTVLLTIDTCPPNFVTATAPYCKRLAQTSGSCDGNVYRQTVQLFVVGDSIQVFYTLMHELGHLLGVDDGADAVGHSADEKSIMFHAIEVPELMSGDAGPDAKMTLEPVQWVRPADSAALRKTWGFAR